MAIKKIKLKSFTKDNCGTVKEPLREILPHWLKRRECLGRSAMVGHTRMRPTASQSRLTSTSAASQRTLLRISRMLRDTT